MAVFYNQKDQDIYKTNKFMPQSRFLFDTPTNTPVVEKEEETESFGIPNTNAFTNSGGNNFNQSGNAFGYGSPVSEVNVRTFNPQSNDPTGSVASAQEAYNQLGDIKDKSIYSNYADINNPIMDNRQNYQANYNSPYEDSMDLGYQGTLGNNEMYPSEKYPNSFMKGKLNRFKNTVGNVANFAGALLPFPLNLATKFLPKGDDNGPGGGTYGVAGLSDAQKEQYNALAKQGMLFSGSSGMKTSTGKNFTGKGYEQGQLDIYDKEFAGLTDDEKAELADINNKAFKAKKFRESAIINNFRQDKKDKIAAADKAYKEKQAADAITAAANTKNPDGSTASYNYAGRDNEFGTHTSTKTKEEAATNRESFRGKDGGRAGYFFGGRVNFKNGGLASIL